MYQIHQIPEGAIYDVAGVTIESPVIPRVGEIITVEFGDTELKLFVHQVAYRYQDEDSPNSVPLTKISMLVGDRPPT